MHHPVTVSGQDHWLPHASVTGVTSWPHRGALVTPSSPLGSWAALTAGRRRQAQSRLRSGAGPRGLAARVLLSEGLTSRGSQAPGGGDCPASHQAASHTSRTPQALDPELSSHLLDPAVGGAIAPVRPLAGCGQSEGRRWTFAVPAAALSWLPRRPPRAGSYRARVGPQSGRALRLQHSAPVWPGAAPHSQPRERAREAEWKAARPSSSPAKKRLRPGPPTCSPECGSDPSVPPPSTASPGPGGTHPVGVL